MYVYHITKREHSDDLSGTGAALFGGRWNRKGSQVLYTGESPEISLLELILLTPPVLLPELAMLTLEIPGDSIRSLRVSDLPSNRNEYPAPAALAEIAEHWIVSQSSLALKVPACFFPGSNLYILNCRHPDYARVKIVASGQFNFSATMRRELSL